MGSAWDRAEVVWIAVGRMTPNPWNPNRMGPDKYKKLRREIRERGFCAPVAVRAWGDGYQIVDGEHRWRIARELGLGSVPAAVLELDEREARIKTLQLNGLRGENDPELLAELIAELAREMGLAELEPLLPFSAEEMEQMVSLLEDRGAEVEPGIARAEVKVPDQELFAVVVTAPQLKDIEDALARARPAEEADDDGAALAAVCRSYHKLSSEGLPGE